MLSTHSRALLSAGSMLALVVATQSCSPSPAARPSDRASSPAVTRWSLPSPSTDSDVSVERALANRRSIRAFSARPLTEAQIGQLLWAAQGVTDPQGRRTAPSAGALYPLELYVVLAHGTFRYVSAEHALVSVRDGDLRPALRSAALGQEAVTSAPLVVVIAAVPARTAARYGQGRATRYVQLEAGHAAQNVLLEAVALELGAVPIGAFDDARVESILGLGSDQVPLYLLPVGYPAADASPSR